MTLLETTAENLAEAQLEELRKHVAQQLSHIINCIMTDKYDDVRKLLFTSPAGDGYGEENQCISFNPALNKDEPWDIGRVLNRMEELSTAIKHARQTRLEKLPKTLPGY